MRRGYYQFVGGFSSAALLLALLVGGATAAFIAFVFANAYEQLEPLRSVVRWVELAVTPVMALLAAAASAATLHMCKVRSRVWVTVAVLAASTGAVVISWHTLDVLHTDRVVVGDLAVIDGPWLALLMASGALIVGAASLAVANVTLDTPLCKFCRHWCVRKPAILRVRPVPRRAARRRIAAGDWAGLRRLGPPQGPRHLRFDLSECDHCGQTRALSVTLVGRFGRKAPVVRNLLIGADARRTLESL